MLLVTWYQVRAVNNSCSCTGPKRVKRCSVMGNTGTLPSIPNPVLRRSQNHVWFAEKIAVSGIVGLAPAGERLRINWKLLCFSDFRA